MRILALLTWLGGIVVWAALVVYFLVSGVFPNGRSASCCRA